MRSFSARLFLVAVPLLWPACASSSGASPGAEAGTDSPSPRPDGPRSRSDAHPDAPASDARTDALHHARDGGADGTVVRDGSVDSGYDATPAGDADPFETYDAGPPVVATTDSHGWSVLPGMPGTPGGYARAIYVDSVNGKETNSGSSPTDALQQIGPSSTLLSQLKAAAATTSIVVVLKPGSSWPSSLDGQLNLPYGGTAAFPLLVTGSRWPGSTGPRPQISAMVYLTADHIAIEGLEVGPGPQGGSGFGEGIHIAGSGETDYLIEDNLITGYANLIEITGSGSAPASNIRIRRNYLFGACGTGAVVGFDGNDIAGALFEDNFFDYNGGPQGACDFTSQNLIPPYSTPNQNPLAHDVYFADDGVRVIALNVTLRHNLFSRTLQSVKGPYTGTMDDNLFYNYLSGGYIGTWGSRFSNNVLMNGGGFATGLDNNHGPNEIPGRKTVFCSNLSYNEGTPYKLGPYAFVTGNTAGVNLTYTNNVIDGFDRAFQLSDPVCFGYDITDNLVESNSFYEVYNPWPIASCPTTVAGNTYHSPAGDTSASANGFGLERPSTSQQYADLAAAEALLGETTGTYDSSPLAFADPTRNITSYLTSSSLATGTPTLLDYLALVRAQSQTAHTWNAKLSVEAINTYLRAGHSLPKKPLTYGSGCP